MPSLDPVSRRELIRKLKALSFRGPFPGGKHQHSPSVIPAWRRIRRMSPGSIAPPWGLGIVTRKPPRRIQLSA